MTNLHSQKIFKMPYSDNRKYGIESNVKKEPKELQGGPGSYNSEFEHMKRIGSSNSVDSLFDTYDYGSKSNVACTSASSMNVTPLTSVRVDGFFEIEELKRRIAQETDAIKTVVLLAGLPASGKSTISKQLCNFLNGRCHKSKIYNAGDIRRRQKGNSFNDSEFFNPDNLQGKYEREMFATTSLNDLMHDLDSGNTSVGFLDATNTTLDRRNKIVQHVRDWSTRANVIIIDIKCTDESLVNFNISGKAYNPDYREKNYLESISDFRERARHYSKIYNPITKEEVSTYEDVMSLYVQVTNGGREYKFINANEADLKVPVDNEIIRLLTEFIEGYSTTEGKRYFEAVDAFYKSKV